VCDIDKQQIIELSFSEFKLFLNLRENDLDLNISLLGLKGIDYTIQNTEVSEVLNSTDPDNSKLKLIASIFPD
jgi:hypothetical protein